MQKVAPFVIDRSNHSAPPPLFFPPSPVSSPSRPSLSNLSQSLMRHPLILLFLPPHLWIIARAESGAHMGACAPVGCGSVNISYPFWSSDGQPEYCGYPTLEVSCRDHKPVLVQTYDQRYYIGAVFYHNSSVLLVNSRLLDTNCSVPHFNVSLGLGPVEISTVNKELVFFSHCGSSLSPPAADYFPITCAGNKSFVRLWQNYTDDATDIPGNQSVGNCTISRIPVSGWNGSTVQQYRTLLSHGFLVELKVTSCSDCHNTGGMCRFNNITSAFMCLCPDGNDYPMSCSNPAAKKVGVKKKTLIVGISVAIGSFLVACCFCLLLHKRKKLKWVSSSSHLLTQRDSSDQYFHDLGMVRSQSTQIFSYEELEKATDGFSPSKELGDGGFGAVYKGTLRDGRIVVVKRLYQNSYKRTEQFMNEVGILSRLHHRNLVSHYGCTPSTSCELLLVYVSNGTVADHLHGPLSGGNTLTWPIRLSIAIETADALSYLHSVEPQIIHRDVKTNNILLDDGFHVKVGDFGLSRLFPMDVSHVSTVPQGTPGYVDPVYHQCYQLTDRSDVYSFGVVLVELILSKPAVDMNRSMDEINLANLVLNKIQRSELDELVDPKLGFQTNLEMRRMVSLVAELAFQCLQSDRDMRPSIKEVLEALKVIEKGAQVGDELEKKNSLKEEAHLLQGGAVFSPVTVMDRWKSSSTTPNISQ